MQLITWILSQPLFWASLSVVFGPILFVRGFRLLQRKRLILDTPRSTVRGAALGPVEISGRAVGPYTLVAPLSQDDCLYYRITVEPNSKLKLQGNKMRELCVPLFVDDGTGRMMIYPINCELQIPSFQAGGEFDKAALATAGLDSEEAEFVREYRIRPGDQIFVLGTLQENPWAKPDPDLESSELSRIGPGFVSDGEADLLRKAACPGLDPTLPSGIQTAADGDFDFHPPVILMKDPSPFVISADSQREIVAKLNWKSLLYIWGGPAAALWGLWEIFEKAKAAGLLPRDF